ncbi:MAG: DUF4097 family beta strand repeat-containing protein [Lachnospiraceae bacterium]|nr:DUF4097 family beta strand repeat-containing protein [Lachnospiraceae bacterium]
MKRAIYLTLLSLITIGCIIFGTIYHTGKAMGHLSRWWEEEVESDADATTEEGKDILDAFTTIHVEADIASVKVKQGDDFKIEWSVYRSGVPTYDVKDGVLTVIQKHPHKNLAGNHSCKIILTLPEGTKLERVEIDADVGDVDVLDISSQKTTVTADVGAVNFDNCQLGDTTVEADVGDVSLRSCDFYDLTVSADVGSITIDATQDLSEYSFDLDAGVGDIHINDQHVHKQFEQHGSGKYKIDADCDVGSLDISFDQESDTL